MTLNTVVNLLNCVTILNTIKLTVKQMNLKDIDISDLALIHRPTGDVIDVDAFMKETTP